MSKKVYFLVICLIVFVSTIMAQRKNVIVYAGDKLIPDNNVNTFIKDTLIDKFVGRWQWQSADSLLTFKFWKVNEKLGGGEKQLEMEMLDGVFYLTKDRDTILNSIEKKLTMRPSSLGKKTAIFFTLFNDSNNTASPFVFRMVDINTLIMDRDMQRKSFYQAIDTTLPIPIGAELKRID